MHDSQDAPRAADGEPRAASDGIPATLSRSYQKLIFTSLFVAALVPPPPSAGTIVISYKWCGECGVETGGIGRVGPPWNPLPPRFRLRDPDLLTPAFEVRIAS